MALASAITWVFQVGKIAGLEPIDGTEVTVEKAFQVRFKLFQVSFGHGWEPDSCAKTAKKVLGESDVAVSGLDGFGGGHIGLGVKVFTLNCFESL